MSPHFELHVRVPDGAPFRALTAQWDGEKIRSVHYIPADCSEGVEGVHPENEVVGELERLLGAHLAYDSEDFASDPVCFDGLLRHLRRPYEFPPEIWDAVCRIRYGRVCNYEDLGHAQTVGNACGNNPFAIVVPCFRVVNKGPDGHLLGEFHKGHAHEVEMETARKIKRWLLEHEGVRVSGSRPDSTVLPPRG